MNEDRNRVSFESGVNQEIVFLRGIRGFALRSMENYRKVLGNLSRDHFYKYHANKVKVSFE